MTSHDAWPGRRQILRIKTGAAALESPSFEQLEAQKLALSEQEAPWDPWEPWGAAGGSNGKMVCEAAVYG